MWLGTLSECAIHDTGDGPSFAYRATIMSSVRADYVDCTQHNSALLDASRVAPTRAC
uniref:Uncharacterized protein n=1 Tax=mine drainage metagenome TaxID=410659 RepID=E6PLT9_9ZZZZ